MSIEFSRYIQSISTAQDIFDLVLFGLWKFYFSINQIVVVGLESISINFLETPLTVT